MLPVAYCPFVCHVTPNPRNIWKQCHCLLLHDVECTLNLLWEFKQYIEDEESDASLNVAISLLTGYCTKILPVITKNGSNLGSNVVELAVSPDEKLGICLDAVVLP